MEILLKILILTIFAIDNNLKTSEYEFNAAININNLVTKLVQENGEMGDSNVMKTVLGIK